MTEAPGSLGSAESVLERALDSYGGFLAHQLGELALLAGAAGSSPGALDGVAGRLSRMLADLSDLSATAGSPVSLDLGSEAKRVAAELSESGRPVVVEWAHASPRVAADADLLRALLGHLMRPSVAASRSGVTFQLRARAGDRQRVHVELEDDRDAPGDADARLRLLPFVRPAGAGPLLGAGVSGPAARRIVVAHGGSLIARAGERGFVAAFDLPAASGP